MSADPLAENEFRYGEKIIARFAPKNLETLRPCMVELIGRTFEWEWCGTGNDDETYPGQSRWLMARKHEAEIPDECFGRWVPFEDLEEVEK
jgi:hypothetical protein